MTKLPKAVDDPVSVVREYQIGNGVVFLGCDCPHRCGFVASATSREALIAAMENHWEAVHASGRVLE